MNEYVTLLKEAEAEYVKQKSRFISHATPATSPEEALAFLDRIRQKHKDASHNCFAYIIGKNAGIMRYSDDGEPSGTAGMPIMEVLKARNVVNAAVVVTRYFGGVLLGAGGLVRAYSHSCALVLDAAQICKMYPSQCWLMEVQYSLWDRVQHALNNLPAQLEDVQFATSITFRLLMKETDAPKVLQVLTTLTDGTLETLLEDEHYHPWPL